MDAIRKIEPYAWASFNVLTGKESIEKLPITSLQPGVYKHSPLYDAQTLASKEAELAARGAEIARLKDGLKWYADGNHVAGLDDDWDTVSGEPQNWLCGPESGMVENGGVAKTVLDGGYIVDDDEIIAEPAMTAEQHKTTLARVTELIARNPDADSEDGMELQQLAGAVERHEKRTYPALTKQPPTE